MSGVSLHGKLPRVVLSIRHYYPDGGGAEVLAHRLSVELVKRGLPLEVLTGRYGRRPDVEIMDGVPVRRHFIGVYVPVLHEICYLLSFAWQLVVRRHKYDIVHVFQTHLSAFVACLIAGGLGKKVITTSHGAGASGDMAVWTTVPYGRQMLKTVCRKVDAATGVSREVMDELVAAGFDPETTRYVPNGVPLPVKAEEQRTRWRTKMRLSAATKVVVFVGRLAAEKAPGLLLEAWQTVSDRCATSRLFFVGDGPQRADLEKRAEQLRVEGTVLFTGWVDNVPDYLGAADLFVLPSMTEGMSVALLEAMAVGLPVVASRVSGTIDVIQDNKNGLLFDSGDDQGLIRCLTSLMASKELRAELGREARRTVERHFSLDAFADRYLELYRSLAPQCD
jgi:glycosyltransferase involved in cell wall biosynthesis